MHKTVWMSEAWTRICSASYRRKQAWQALRKKAGLGLGCDYATLEWKTNIESTSSIFLWLETLHCIWHEIHHWVDHEYLVVPIALQSSRITMYAIWDWHPWHSSRVCRDGRTDKVQELQADISIHFFCTLAWLDLPYTLTDIYTNLNCLMCDVLHREERRTFANFNFLNFHIMAPPGQAWFFVTNTHTRRFG